MTSRFNHLVHKLLSSILYLFDWVNCNKLPDFDDVFKKMFFNRRCFSNRDQRLLQQQKQIYFKSFSKCQYHKKVNDTCLNVAEYAKKLFGSKLQIVKGS